MDVKEYFEAQFKEDVNIDTLISTSIDIPNEIPNEMPKYEKHEINLMDFEQNFLNSMKEYVLKSAYNRDGMYGFVSWRWIDPFVEWIKGRKVLEVMAGRGWLSHALRLKGVDVIATDNFSWSNRSGWKEPLTRVIEEDAIKSIDLYGDKVDIVIMSWPYMDNTAFQVLKRLHEINHSALVVYIGEGYGGCTADDKFHDFFDLVEDENFDKVISRYQCWQSVHDHPFLGKYKDR